MTNFVSIFSSILFHASFCDKIRYQKQKRYHVHHEQDVAVVGTEHQNSKKNFLHNYLSASL